MKVLLNTLLIILLLFSAGCRDVSVPKPRGYFRIDFPEKRYVSLADQPETSDMPFTFEYPVYGKLTPGTGMPGEEGWFNIEFPSYKAIIYLTYKPVNEDFAAIMEQTYRMNVKNHIPKADAINEQAYNNEEKDVFAVLYDLKGNTATAVQFYATDSTKHYLRGSLYFDSEPDADSLAPVIDFFRKDIMHLVETLGWSNNK